MLHAGALCCMRALCAQPCWYSRADTCWRSVHWAVHKRVSVHIASIRASACSVLSHFDACRRVRPHLITAGSKCATPDAAAESCSSPPSMTSSMIRFAGMMGFSFPQAFRTVTTQLAPPAASQLESDPVARHISRSCTRTHLFHDTCSH